MVAVEIMEDLYFVDTEDQPPLQRHARYRSNLDYSSALINGHEVDLIGVDRFMFSHAYDRHDRWLTE